MNFLKNALVTILLLSLLSGCGPTIEPNNSNSGITYFPLEKGLFKTYDAEVIEFTLLGFDTTKFQLKEIVVDSFFNADNGYTYILNRYTRSTSEDDWKIDSVWTARKSANQIIVTENNISYAKLSFPIEEGLKWNGNAYNAKGEEIYAMQNIEKEQTFNGKALKTLGVLQGSEKTLVRNDQRHETYAENVGLVEKFSFVVEYVSDSQDEQYAKDVIVAGRSYTLSLIDYGKE